MRRIFNKDLMDLPRTGRERQAGVIIENINELLKNKTNHTNFSLEERKREKPR